MAWTTASTSARSAARHGPWRRGSRRLRAMEAAEREVTSCVWCGNELDSHAIRLKGRTRCARCGASTTDPRPSDTELQTAYRGWYRPESGRFAFPGDALLRRTRRILAGRIDHVAPPGPVLD